MVPYLGSLVQLCSAEGATLQTSITGVCGECSQCLGHTGFVPTHGICALQVFTAQVPGCSAGELSKAAPGLRAFPRFKSLRFRFSGIPQRHRLGWACVLCLFQVQAAEATRCLVSMLSSGGWCILSPPWSQPFGFLGVQRERCPRCAMCLLWGADLWLRPSWQMSTIRIPGRLG